MSETKNASPAAAGDLADMINLRPSAAHTLAAATEIDINDRLLDALEAIADARLLLHMINASGMSADLRRTVRDLEGMVRWSQANRGWAEREPA